MTAVLSIDQGTSGTKAAVVDESGIGPVFEEAVRPSYLPGGGVEQDPEALWQSVLTTGRRALGDRDVDSIALANQGETVLAWDPRTGTPLSPAIVWQDRRSAGICRELQGVAAEVAARTGLVLDPYFSAPKMAWLRRHGCEGGVVTTTDVWLLHRLTGAFVTDVSTASRSLLLDLDSRSWDRELVNLFGLSGERLPAVVDCDTIVGSTEAFGRDTPVGGLIVDQQAALFAERCLEAGEAKCTYGTGAFLLANTGAVAVRSTAGLSSSVAWQTRDSARYCLDGQVYTAASAVRWLKGLGFIGSAAELDQAAAADDGGVLCVPALAGLAAPWWRPDATGSFTGLTLSSRPGHVVLALLEGIAAQIAELVDVVRGSLAEPLTALRADGGLTRSRVLMQAQADIAQLPVEIYPSAHATLLGAAAFARLSNDPNLHTSTAVDEWTPELVYEPSWSADRAGEFRARWRTLAQAA